MINVMTIRLIEGFTLRDAALEIQALNQFVNPEGAFHTAIPSNPDSENSEGFLGINNTAPSPEGFIKVQFDGYDWLDTSMFPQMPQTFGIIPCGAPPVANFA